MAHSCHYVKALQRYSLGVSLASCLRFVAALYKIGFVYRHKIHNFLPAWSEDDLSQIW